MKVHQLWFDLSEHRVPNQHVCCQERLCTPQSVPLVSWRHGQCDDDNELMLNVLRCHLTYQGQVVTNAEARFNNSLRPRKPEGSLGRTAQDVYLDSHTAPELCQCDDDDDELMLNVLRCQLTY